MATVIKFLKTLRTHWKKSTFAACAIGYGTNYAKQSYEIQTLMEEYCKEAALYGRQPLQPHDNPRKVLVILNPTANRRKSVKQFEQYCVPILHLAGIIVDVIQTKAEGDARTILEKEHQIDAVVIAGGDGTISESITGLLRKEEYLNIPVGVLPLGKDNSFASTLFPSDESGKSGKISHVRRLAEASMAIVKDKTKLSNVIKIETIPENHKPIFALSGVEWGSYRDAHSKLDKYWYFGPFRKYATYIFNNTTRQGNTCTGSLTYSPPCDGCTNCYRQPAIQQQQPMNNRWWNSFAQTPTGGAVYQQLEYNEQCATTEQKTFSTIDFTLNVGPRELLINLGPESLKYWDFVKDGCASENGQKRTVKETISARQIELHPTSNEDSFYSIDHEDFETKPIKVTLIPKLIKVFFI